MIPVLEIGEVGTASKCRDEIIPVLEIGGVGTTRNAEIR